MKRRLFHQIYLSVIGVAIAVVLLAMTFGRLFWMSGERAPRFLERSAESIARALEREGLDAPDLRGRLQRHARAAGVWASLWDERGELIAFSGPRHAQRHLERRAAHAERHALRDPGGLLRDPDGPLARVPGVGVELAAGHWLRVVPDPHGERARRPGLLASILLFGLAIAAGAYPVARRIARRLERLQRGVERLGRGDLDARVEVEGDDEVAALARSFNRSADHVGALVQAQRRILASASHELRTPLARLRMALWMLAESSGRSDLRDEAERDIDELDGLIEDLLLSARVQSGVETPTETLDFAALVAEEIAHYGDAVRLQIAGSAGAAGAPLAIEGNRRELRRLVRNLLDNAARHGRAGGAAGAAGGAGAEAAPIEVEVEPTDGGGLRLRVLDRGPGVATGERERIFEPFHRPAGHSEGEDGGVGLGLALVREIARQHGGDAHCFGREGGGSVFEVRLGPRRLAHPADVAELRAAGAE